MKTRRNFLSVLAAAACFAAGPVSAQLSVINLKDGKTIEGFVVSRDEKSVKIETLEGKTLTLLATSFDVIEETKRWGDAEIDQAYADADANSAEEIAKVAEAAKAKNHGSWRHLLAAAMKLDKDDETANRVAGNEKVGDKWFKAKSKEYEEAKKKLVEAEMKDKGFIKVGSGDKLGWVPKTAKGDYDKDPKKYMLNEERVYEKIEDVMRAQGKELVGGKWVRAATLEDKKESSAFKSEFEADLVVMSSKHFRLMSTEHKAPKVDEFLELAERNYAWFLKQMGKPADTELFPEGRRGELWFLRDKRMFDKFVNNHGASRFGLSADWIAHITRPGGGSSTLSGLGLHAVVPVEDIDDARAMSSIIHNTSHMLTDWFVMMPGKGSPDWLTEAWAHFAEHHFMNNGQQTCTTKANYGAGGGISDKKFTTKDAKDRCKAMARDREGEVFENISKKELNSLSGDDLAKGYSIVDWLMKTRRVDFIRFMEGMRGGDPKEAQLASLKANLGWDYNQIDDVWTKMARKEY